MAYDGRHHRHHDRYPPQYTRGHHHHHNQNPYGVGRPPRGAGGYQTVEPPNAYPPNYPTAPNMGGNQSFYNNGGYNNNNYIPQQNYGNSYNCPVEEPYDYDDEGNLYYDDDDYFDYDDVYYGDGFNNFGDSYEQQQQQQQQPTQQQIQSQQQNQAIIQSLKQPTNIKFDVAKFDIECSFCGRDFFVKHEDPKTKKVSWRLKDEGKLICNVLRGNTKATYGSKGADFHPELANINNDLIKSVRITALKTDYPTRMVIAFPTIPTFNNEKARDNASFFNHLITPALFDKKGIYSAEVFNREITNGMIEFANTYPGHTPDNMDSKISWIRDPVSGKPTHGVISVANETLSPLVFFFNKDHPEGDPLHIKGPSLGLHEINGYLMKKEDIDRYSELAKTKINEKFSLGNVTNSFNVEISVERPAALMNVKNFSGFGDARAVFPRVKDVKLDKMPGTDISYLDFYMNKEYTLSFHLEMEYKKLDGKPILY